MGSELVLGHLRDFTAKRDWAQFHTEANLAKSITIEAGELLECFQWSEDFDRNRVQEELADVLTYAYGDVRLGLLREARRRVRTAERHSIGRFAMARSGGWARP